MKNSDLAKTPRLAHGLDAEEAAKEVLDGWVGCTSVDGLLADLSDAGLSIIWTPRKRAAKRDWLILKSPNGRAKGGHARAAKLSAEERSAIARKAASARWGAP